MSLTREITLDSNTKTEFVADIRNQTVRDPSPSEISERSAEIRQSWSKTRWRKEQRRFRNRGWTVPEVRVAQSTVDAH